VTKRPLVSFDEKNDYGTFDCDSDDTRRIFAPVSKILPFVIEKELTDKQRQCFEMHYFSGYSTMKIGQKLGIKRQTAWSFLDRARKKLNKKLYWALEAAKRFSD
jgi:DNA-directed RNA polymerase specialized sigma subunit